MAKAKGKTASKAKSPSKSASKSDAKGKRTASLFERLVANVSDEVLHETPVRAAKVLQAIAARPRVMLAMSQRGYGQREHDNGWTLLRPVFRLGPSTVRAAARTPQANAIAALDAWDEPNIPILRTALTGELAKVGAFVLDGIEPQTGIGAVAGVALLLERINDLESLGADTRAAGIDKNLAKSAMKKLERRGFTKDERGRLATLVAMATSTPHVPAADDPNEAIERHNHLVRLREWYDETTAIARTQVKRGDDLIALGLAERKATKRAAAAAAPAAP